MQSAVKPLTLTIPLWSVRSITAFRIPYVLHSPAIISDSKFHHWSECIRLGTPYRRNHSCISALAVVVAFWSFVGIATVNLLKTSVITNTFSRPPEAGSSTVKSMASISNGFVANYSLRCVFKELASLPVSNGRMRCTILQVLPSCEASSTSF